MTRIRDILTVYGYVLGFLYYQPFHMECACLKCHDISPILSIRGVYGRVCGPAKHMRLRPGIRTVRFPSRPTGVAHFRCCAFLVLRTLGDPQLLTFILHVDYQRSSDPSLLMLYLDDSQQVSSHLARCIFELMFRASRLDGLGPHFRSFIS